MEKTRLRSHLRDVGFPLGQDEVVVSGPIQESGKNNLCLCGIYLRWFLCCPLLYPSVHQGEMWPCFPSSFPKKRLPTKFNLHFDRKFSSDTQPFKLFTCILALSIPGVSNSFQLRGRMEQIYSHSDKFFFSKKKGIKKILSFQNISTF